MSKGVDSSGGIRLPARPGLALPGIELTHLTSTYRPERARSAIGLDANPDSYLPEHGKVEWRCRQPQYRRALVQSEMKSPGWGKISRTQPHPFGLWQRALHSDLVSAGPPPIHR